MSQMPSFKGVPRIFPVKLDMKYRPVSYNPKSPYVPKEQYSVATRIVAADGSGDFEDIQQAINDLPSSGGKVFIKEGVYSVTDLVLKSNVELEGASKGAIVRCYSSSTSKNKYMNFANLTNIALRNLTLELRGDLSGVSGVKYHIDLSGTSIVDISNAQIFNYFEDTSASPGDLAVFYTDSSTQISIFNSIIDNKESGNLGGIFMNSFISKSRILYSRIFTAIINTTTSGEGLGMEELIIEGNVFQNIWLLDEAMNRCIIIGNKVTGSIETGDVLSSDANIISSNLFTRASGYNLYLGSQANYNVVVGNVYNSTIHVSGTDNTVANNQSY